MDDLDPAHALTASQQFASSLLFNGLLKFSSDLHVVPELAVSMPTISSGGRYYTFTLRQDARYQDGTFCTANDMARSFVRALSPAERSPTAKRALGGIVGAAAVEKGSSNRLSGVTVIDRSTLRIHLQQPDSTFLEKLALPAADLVRPGRHTLARAGTGAWSLEGRSADSTLTFRPRPHFYGGPLELHSLVLKPVIDSERGLDLYRHDDVDAVQVPASLWDTNENRSDFHQSSSMNVFYAVVDDGGGRALETQLDRTALVARTSPALTPLAGVVPPAVPDYLSPVSSSDPSGSRTRMRAVVKTPPAGTDRLTVSLARSLSGQLKSGAEVSHILLVHEWRSLPDPSVWLELVDPWVKSSWLQGQIRQAIRLTNDPVGRMNAYGRGESYAISTGRVIPLASESLGYLVRNDVHNLQVTPEGLMPGNDNWSTVSIG